jgi:beta-propeller repeat-containing protein/List-Bact-rpt repeat protein
LVEVLRHRSLVVLLVLFLSILITNLPTPKTIADQPHPGALYQTTWGSSNYDYGQAVAVDQAGNTYVTGYTWSFTPGTPSIFLLKYNFTGALLMQRLWTDGADDYAYGIALDRIGNIYIVGWTNNLGGPTILLLKFNPTGGLVWQKTYAGGTNPAYGQAVAVDSIGNIYVTGYYSSTTGTDQNATIIKFDSTGNLIWQKSWGGSNPEQGKGVTIDPSGNVVVTGFTNSFGAGGADVFILKFSPVGALLSQLTWGGAGDDKGDAITIDNLNNTYLTGSTTSSGLTSQAFLLKFNSTGFLVIKKYYGLAGATVGYGISENSTTGEIWIAGTTIIGPNTKGFVLRLTSGAGIISQVTYGGIGGSDTVNGVADDTNGNVMLTGYVGEAGPYTFSNVTGTLTNSNLNATKTSRPALDPGFSVGFASGTVSTPSGVSSYAGGTDVLIAKYGTIPLITFNTSPAGAGTIKFYSDDDRPSGNFSAFPYGTYEASAKGAPGYKFVYWTTEGDVLVQDNKTSPTWVGIIGPGTLIAVFVVDTANITLDILPYSAGGTVTCNGQIYANNITNLQVKLGTQLTCTANPYAGNRFVRWSGLSTATTKSTSFNVTQSGVLGASFNGPGLPSLQPPLLILSGALIAVLALPARRKK